MAGLLPPGILTFLDSNGDPLVGGSVGYYEPNTGGATLKAIWTDEGQTIPAQNPIPLDQAGRPFSGGSEVSVFGTGQYAMYVYNGSGTLQWSATTYAALGLSDLTHLQTEIDTETAARIAADNAEAATRAAADTAETNARAAADTTLQNNINTEVARAEAAETTLTNAINSEISRAEAAESHLQDEINALLPGTSTGNVFMQTGSSSSDDSGNVSITFPVAFTKKAMSFQIATTPNPNTPTGVFFQPTFTPQGIAGSPTLTGAVGTLQNDPADDGHLVPVAHANFNWFVIGV